jgi:hypothetical protein
MGLERTTFCVARVAGGDVLTALSSPRLVTLRCENGARVRVVKTMSPENFADSSSVASR